MAPASAEVDLGGSFRAYGFHQVEDDDLTVRQDDSQLAILRLTATSYLDDHWSVELHAVGEWQRPAQSLESSIATAPTRNFLELQRDSSPDELQARYLLDRAALRYDSPALRLTVGRQAISWGVARFWPTLDLFAPFAAQRLDRAYKAGVDAVRATIPAGQLAEIDLVAASLGPSVTNDGALAALYRRQLGTADVGLMIGTFHRDLVAGAFIEADLDGTGVYAETAYTYDRDNPQQRFWRATAGLTRQLTPTITGNFELAYNDFGATNTNDYLPILLTERFQRGEIQAFSRFAAAANLSFQLHPLVTLSTTILVNHTDHSALFLPALSYSAGDNATIDLGAVITSGPRTTSPFAINSQYNLSPSSVYFAWTWYF